MEAVHEYARPSAKPIEIGAYLCDRDYGLKYRSSGIPCPYCQRALLVLTEGSIQNAGRLRRVVQVLRPWRKGEPTEVLTQFLSSDLRLLGCVECHSRFTVPVSRLPKARGRRTPR